MSWAVSTKKDFIGRRSHRRPDTSRADRKQLVGLLPLDPDALLPEGAQLVAPDADLGATPVPMLGHVTSSYRSAALGRTFALALVKGGRDRIGQRVLAPLVEGVDRGGDRRLGRVRPGEHASGRRARHDRGARRMTARACARIRRSKGSSCRRVSASCPSWPRSTCGPIHRTRR